MSLQKKIILAVILGIGLYGGVFLYAINSEAFQFAKGEFENSSIIVQRVGKGPRVTMPLFGNFHEKYINSSRIVTMKLMVVGDVESILVDVRVVRKDGIWKIESSSIDGVPVSLL